MTHKSTITTAVALLTIVATLSTAGLAAPDAAYDDKLSLGAEQATQFLGSSPNDIVKASTGVTPRPTWMVRVEPDRLDTLESWANETENRRVLQRNNHSRWAVVAAPPAAIDGGLVPFGTELTDLTYVERVSLNRNLDYATPIQQLETPNTTSPPPDSRLLYGTSYNSSGVAYDDDAETATMADVREVLNTEAVPENGSGIKVAIVDSGIRTALGRTFGNGSEGSTIRIDAAKNFITDESANASNGWNAVDDGNSHGTFVAAQIAANNSNDTHDGILPTSSLLVARALDDEGSGSTGDIVDAIYWAERNNATILSMSLGSPTYSPPIATAIKDALDGNVTAVVVAAGNSRMSPVHSQRYISSPADVDGAISVAATNTQPAEDAEVAYFSEVGPDNGATDLSRGTTVGEGPDIAAPGMKIKVRMPTESGTVQPYSMSGTSMAAPNTAAVAGLAVANDSDTLFNESSKLRARMLEGARPVPAAGTTEVGHGLTAAGYTINGSVPAEQQVGVRSTGAIARDEANDAYSGSPWIRRAISGRANIQSLLGI